MQAAILLVTHVVDVVQSAPALGVGALLLPAGRLLVAVHPQIVQPPHALAAVAAAARSQLGCAVRRLGIACT